METGPGGVGPSGQSVMSKDLSPDIISEGDEVGDSDIQEMAEMRQEMRRLSSRGLVV